MKPRTTWSQMVCSDEFFFEGWWTSQVQTVECNSLVSWYLNSTWISTTKSFNTIDLKSTIWSNRKISTSNLITSSHYVCHIDLFGHSIVFCWNWTMGLSRILASGMVDQKGSRSKILRFFFRFENDPKKHIQNIHRCNGSAPWRSKQWNWGRRPPTRQQTLGEISNPKKWRWKTPRPWKQPSSPQNMGTKNLAINGAPIDGLVNG